MNRYKSLLEIFWVASRLGLTSFGGPTAHLGYFHQMYVQKKKWLDEKTYADLVALSQFLPGPASSQVGIGIGILRAGIMGGIISFVGFTLPSVIALILFALLLTGTTIGDSGLIHGLKIVAVAVVAHAIVQMAKSLTPDLKRKTIALFAVVITLFWQTPFTQVSVILIAALVGYLLYTQQTHHDESISKFAISKKTAIFSLLIFFILIILLPIIRDFSDSYWLALFDSFYRSGSFVFGGGHVVLPLLEQEFVPSGWISDEAFLTGYGATQAVPGPLFTFSAYLGTIMMGWKGGLVATFAIFLPAFLLLIGVLPFWDQLRHSSKVKGAIMGVNAAVIGLLISAFYFPIWTSTMITASDFALAAILFFMLAYWKLPPWVVVISGALGGIMIGLI